MHINLGEKERKRQIRRKQEKYLVQAVYNAFIENKKVFGLRRIKRHIEVEKNITISE